MRGCRCGGVPFIAPRLMGDFINCFRLFRRARLEWVEWRFILMVCWLCLNGRTTGITQGGKDISCLDFLPLAFAILERMKLISGVCVTFVCVCVCLCVSVCTDPTTIAINIYIYISGNYEVFYLTGTSYAISHTRDLLPSQLLLKLLSGIYFRIAEHRNVQ